ncbi:hypothetical protein PSTG_03958 [Puccinia striiformis f. sp. tritici PST-78]|uniref:Rab-GAP TBC domain-containing protein n=2 Tax=Puccinia striiformis f. sp. tritici TaxID=168172 RepID=A0A0L0VTY6_9BASI|nr:hypothetical protein PSTG_03958 [Puccinia striiformis f. sp. tritici PST-78]
MEEHPLSPNNHIQEAEAATTETKTYFDLKAHSDLLITEQRQQQNEQQPSVPGLKSKRIKLIRDDTLKQTEQSHENSSATAATTSENTQKIPSKILKISLSDQPHLIPTKSQLLVELKKIQNPGNLPGAVDQNALNLIMLSLIRELSLQLNQTQEELRNSQLELNGLNNLLADTYSVGKGEIERCRLRARVPNQPQQPSSPDPTTTTTSCKKQAWHLELHDQVDCLIDNLNFSSTSSLGPSCSSGQLDLDDLREAMSDNPCFDTASSSSCPSRSQLTSPASQNSHIPESPRPNTTTINTSSTAKKTYHPTSVSSLFNPTGILNGRYRKSAPIPPILPPSSDHQYHDCHEESASEHRPIASSSTLHKRTASIGSSLSGVSSVPSNRLPPNNVWGLYGWKWNKRNKTSSPPVSGQLDSGNGRVDIEQCLSPDDGQLNHPTLLLGGSASIDRELYPEPSGLLSRPQQSPIETSSSTILSGLFDSLTRRKRAESNHSHLQKPSIQSFNSRTVASGSSEEPLRASINAPPSLITRSSSLILNSSSSINTQSTSSSSSCSLHDTGRNLNRSNSGAHPLSESALSSLAPSALHSASSSSDITPPLTGTERLINILDKSLLDPSSSTFTRATGSQSTPLAKLSRSDTTTASRWPSLINLKSPAESFVSTSKGLPTLATHADTIVHSERFQLSPALSGLSADIPKPQFDYSTTNYHNRDHTRASPDGDSSSLSQSINSSVTGPAGSTTELNEQNSSRLRSQASHQNLSIRSSKSSVVTSASQMKSKPQVKLTQPATTKSYLSTATGTIGKALGANSSSGMNSPVEFEPNVTTVPNVAFGRLASVYFRAPDSQSSGSASRSSSNKARSTSILSTGQAPHHRSVTNMISGIDHGSLGSLGKQSSSITIPTESINHHDLNKLNLKYIPPLSNSTMELSTFINPQSNPPLFSNFGRDEDGRGFDAPLGPSPAAGGEDEPIVDRFGFIVDVKYGLKLMRKSRDKKKQQANQRLAALEQQQFHHSLPSQLPASQPLIDSVPPTEPSPNKPIESVLPPAQTTEENNKFNSTYCDASVEGSDLDHTPMMTTALPIKSQVDVEAELSSLREALGLSPVIKTSSNLEPEGSTSDSPGNQGGNEASSSSAAAALVDPVIESSTQSIRRLLFQLNEMQNMLEKKQMEAWGQFITKRRMKLMKVSNSTSPQQSHLAPPTTSSSEPPSITGKLTTTIQGTGAVSPASVGAFLGTVALSGSSSSPTGTILPKTSHSISGQPNTKRSSSISIGGDSVLDYSSNKSKVRDLITCHDDNLIGIASMGLSNDNNKKALKDEWKEFKDLVILGIPIALRPKIWLECSGATDLKEPGYYHDLLHSHHHDDGACLNQIECDVTRTLPTNVYFGGDGPGVSKLRRVLAAMSWHNPVVGYCQGMNMVAATLLLTIPSEEDAFWILVCIVDKILPPHYYTSHLLTSQADQRVLKVLVHKYLAELDDHFDALDVELPAITFGWFLSLFADALPIQTLLRVFDLFLIDGSLLLFRISLALLKINQATILSHDSPASLYAYMRGPMTLSSHHADKLINVATVDFGDIKNSTIVSLREKFVDQIKVEMGLPD